MCQKCKRLYTFKATNLIQFAILAYTKRFLVSHFVQTFLIPTVEMCKIKFISVKYCDFRTNLFSYTDL